MWLGDVINDVMNMYLHKSYMINVVIISRYLCTGSFVMIHVSLLVFFSRSSVKFQGHTALKIVDFDPNWAFPDCNSGLNSPMAMKCCTKLETAKEMPYCFSRSSIKFQGHTIQNITDFDPNWAFLDCNSSLNWPMATKCCIELEVA